MAKSYINAFMHSEKKALFMAGALLLASTALATAPSVIQRPALPSGNTTVSGSGELRPAARKATTGVQHRIGENNPLIPPFCETFDNFRPEMEHDDFPRYFDVIDSNGDDRSWGMYNYAGDRPYGKCSYMLFPMTGAAADDWLITRATKLEKGKYYCVSVYAGLYKDTSEDTPQVFEVKIGNYNDAAGMKTTVIPATKVTTDRMTRVYGWFTPQFTAKYYVGVHGISPTYPDYYNYLFIDNIAVDAPKDGGVPAEVTDVTMTNDPDGTPAVDISFAAPATALDGTALTALSSISVKRGGTVVKTFDAPQPGKQYTFRDQPATEGDYEYEITATNAVGEGASCHRTHTSGIGAPLAPIVTDFREQQDGNIHLAWTAPVKDVNGSPINPSKVTYNVYDIIEEDVFTIATETSATEVTYDAAVEQGQQRMAIAMLTAVLNGKESEAAATSYIFVGTPYCLPYHNSFTLEHYYKYAMAMETKSDVKWMMLDDNSDPKAQDGDSGYACMVGSMPGQTCELSFGKIDLRESENPLLSFYTYVYSDDENLINVYITDCATGAKTKVTAVALAQFSRVGWHKVTIPLKEFAGKVVSLGIEGEIATHGYIPVDNLMLHEMSDIDLSVGDITYPFQAEVDAPFNIYVNVLNGGVKEVSDYTVSLLVDGREVANAKGEAVPSLSEATVVLTDRFSAVSPAATDYTVRINVEGDPTPENNVSAPFSIVLIAPVHPTVADLAATDNNGAVTLTWTAPDLSKAAPEEATEDFERYQAFANKLDGWSMIDGDGGYVAGFNGVSMPVNGTTQAYWVMSAEDEFDFLPTVSGKNALVAMYAFDSKNRAVANDDWLISPELYGGVQTLDFWATSLTEDYGCEEIEVYYSTTGKAKADFQLLVEKIDVPQVWENYFVALPKGTKYFAIRYLSENRYMLLLDDITYIPAGTPRALELKGYNVYRNGVKLNAKPVDATTFATTRELNQDSYFVTAVYDLGESVGSNVVTLGGSSVSDVIVDAEAAPVEVFNLHGVRIDPSTASPGVYIRRAGTDVRKIIIK